jgi:hypothetical protein
MARALQAASGIFLKSAARKTRALNWERMPIFYARNALGAAFLSGIASRFGLYGKNVGYRNFANFVKYTAEVNSFLPAYVILFLAWSATAAELVGNRLDSRGVAPRGSPRKCAVAGAVWHHHGHLFRDQVSARLFGFFRVSRSSVACTAQQIWSRVVNSVI